MQEVKLTLSDAALTALGGAEEIQNLVAAQAQQEIEGKRERIRAQIVAATVAAIGALDETGTQKAIEIIAAIQADPTTVDRLHAALAT